MHAQKWATSLQDAKRYYEYRDVIVEAIARHRRTGKATWFHHHSGRRIYVSDRCYYLLAGSDEPVQAEMTQAITELLRGGWERVINHGTEKATHSL
ncbi:hypothetical protein EXIGUO8H_20357 [Exiguobacterium sp. 8H]|uniref:hypothetical protein n=1 Tax=unclassified Exiguobacterium TaxID=2644629 RepID=UPI0012F1846E|nr:MULTISPECIES: hypothetical protein [unclassified Exiguobacterium]VXB52434.1 hypothetical protein EXIGUO8A_11426 [Exiguobacterium sp. 8A]VXB53189.1 hypothetical protein EXIGUO8H_20357 [Exiguobacterium sp. 8H]